VEWRRVHPQFSVPLERIKTLSKQSLINNGLIGGHNANMAKFVLSSNHGMVERQTHEHEGTSDLADLLRELDGNSKGKLPQETER
jgi:hypothetical protein